MGQEEDAKIRTVKELLCKLVDKRAWEQALVIGEYLASLEPDSILAYQALGYAALNMRDLEKSEQYFQKAMDRGDCEAMTYLQVARLHSCKNDLNGEIFWLEKTLEQDPDSVVARYNLALTRRALGEPDAAEGLLREIVQKHPDNIPSWKSLAEIHLAAGDMEAAEQDLRSAVAADGKISQIHADLATILKQRDKHDEAVAEYFRALETEPQNPFRYYDIGDTFLALNENDKAITYLMKAVDMDPDNPLFSYNLGLAFFQTGRYSDCEAANLAALRNDSHMMSARTNLGLSVTTNLGLAYLNQGKLAEAEQCFRRNLLLTASSHFNLGLALHWQCKYDEALVHLLHAVELVPDDVPYLDMAGNAWLELGDLDHAQEAFEKAISINSGYPPAQYDLGVVFSRRKGMEKEALDQFMKAIALDEAYPLPYYAAACIHALEGKKDPALENLRKAVDRGFTNRTHADEDHDLDSLRDDPEFRKIMDIMASKNGQAEKSKNASEKPVKRQAQGEPGKKVLGSGKAHESIDPEVMRYIW